MATRIFTLLFSACLLGACKSQEPVRVIAFGSCAKQDQPQPIWDKIVEHQPDLFLFLGDNIYADTLDLAEIRAKYDMLAAQPGYQRLRATCPVLATWDDHDYGSNDAGMEYPAKHGSKRVFMNFFEEPNDSPRWLRDGIYMAKMFGPAKKRVQIILLDTRWFRGPLATHPKGRIDDLGPYVPSPETAITLLGEAQWKWLRRQLKQPAKVRIIASSIQVVADEHGWECWGNFPHERQRLYDLIAETGAKGVVFVSGDRHHMELSLESDGPYPLYDLTSSGLNQSRKMRQGEPNVHRIGEVNLKPNFGLIRIDWARRHPRITFDGRGLEDQVFVDLTVKLRNLRKSAARSGY